MKFNLSDWALRHRTLTLFFLLMLTAAGGLAYATLGLKEEPEFKFKAMIVRVLWPGASAEEIEQQVTDRIERKLQDTPHLDYLRSYSRPGESVVFVNLLGSTRARDVDDTWYQVRKKVADIRGQLPAGVIGPFFNDEFGDTYSNIYALSGEGLSYAELKTYADVLRADILRVPGVEKADLLGVQEEKVWIEFSHKKLAALGVDPQQLFGVLAQQNQVVPAGRVTTDAANLQVRVTGGFESVQAIESVALRVNGRSFRVGDVASVRRGYADPPAAKMRHQGREVIGVAVTMRSGGDAVALGQGLDAAVKRLQSRLPIGLDIATVANQPQVVKRSAAEFNRSLAEALAIVLAVSFLSLGLRTGMVVALTIPIVLAITFLGMKLAGIELHRISFGALIIALGLLVDDAMIAVEMMARKLEEGYDKLRAATFAYKSTAFPMLTGTLITAAGFMPIGLSRAVASEYTNAIFWVTLIALLASWVVAVTFTPYLGSMLLEQKRAAHEAYGNRFYRNFRKLVEGCIEHRWKTMAMTVMAFAASLALFGLVPKQFFPSSNRPEMIISLRHAEDSSFAVTEANVKRVERLLAADEDISQYTSYVGQSSPRFYLPLMQEEFGSPNYAEVVAVARDSLARERAMARLRTVFERDFPELRARIERLPNGPPVGYPVQFRVSGENPELVARYAREVAAVVRAHPATVDVNLDWHERQRALKLVVDQDKARALGLTSAQIRHALWSTLTGVAVTDFREGDRTIEVVARAQEDERTLAGAVADVNLYTPSGKFVPVAQVARVELALEEARTWRRNRLPTVTVRADVLDGVQAPDVTDALLAKMGEIRDRLPPGYYLDAGGSWYESRINERAIQAVFPVMILVVITLLMLQLQSFSKMAMVVLTAPLGMIGVVGALLVFRAPMGFVAQLGIIALFGMIMRNSVILVDQIRQDIEAGHEAWTAIRESAVRRFRPIMLTAAAAVLAMIPLTRSELWGPMAMAIMGGLIVATVLTLLFVPALYAAWYRVKRPGAIESRLSRKASDDGPRTSAYQHG
ncbi:MAG: efflux RND transporter permease subunit [Betaproteobacteria bacterium]|nr:MAG: efflux RND transporter permease subunit [Betaproteobacteria bacterium]